MPSKQKTSSRTNSPSSPSSKDETDSKSLQIKLDEVKDRVEVMLKLECTLYKRQSCMLRKYVPESEDSDWRELIVVWMHNIVRIFRLKPCVLEVGMFFVDTIVGKGLVHKSSQYQLVALTSLHLAMKLYEVKLFPMAELLKLSQGAFLDADVATMENTVLNQMKWNLHPPTAYCFVEQFLQVFPSVFSHTMRKDAVKRSHKLIFHMVQQSAWVSATPSRVAYASLLVALEHQGYDGGLSLDDFQLYVDEVENVTNIRFDDAELVKIIDYLVDGGRSQGPTETTSAVTTCKNATHADNHAEGESVGSTSATDAVSDSEDDSISEEEGRSSSTNSKRKQQQKDERREPSMKNSIHLPSNMIERKNSPRHVVFVPQ